jgi:hypothetical protein
MTATTGDDTLETVTGKINAYWRKSDDYRVTIAQLMVQAKTMVEAGDPAAEGMSWRQFTVLHFTTKDGSRRSLRDINRLLQIGHAPDPQGEADRQREANREQMARTRQDTRVSQTDPTVAERFNQPGMPRLGGSLGDIKQWIVDELDEDERLELYSWLGQYLDAATASPQSPIEPAVVAEAQIPVKPASPPPAPASTRGYAIGKVHEDCAAPEHKCRYGGCAGEGRCIYQPPPQARGPADDLPLGTPARKPASAERPAVAI